MTAQITSANPYFAANTGSMARSWLATAKPSDTLARFQNKESNATTCRLALMNCVLRGIEADIGKERADTFRHVQHPDLRADYVLSNPPFNDSDWFCKDDDVRWQFGVPPKGNASTALHHLN